MTHVEIKFKKDGSGFVAVDGFVIPVLADGFGVEFSPQFGANPIVRMQIVADTLDIDLPDAVIEAMRAEADNA